MRIITTIGEMQEVADSIRREGRDIGFVPTMGFLHEGHLSLIRMARQRADVVVVSIFVNPIQFGPGEDLATYPRDFERDCALAEKAGADIILHPEAEEMYGGDFLTYVEVGKITESLCGARRPGHFRGVATVCAKLFNAVKPHFAVFGQKDYQQSLVIRRMAADLNLDLDIITGPIIRESDGLAMSSRNTYLSSQERKEAAALQEALQLGVGLIREEERSVPALKEAMRQLIEEKPSARIDYLEIVDPDTLEELSTVGEHALLALAVYIGNTRLIDNILF